MCSDRSQSWGRTMCTQEPPRRADSASSAGREPNTGPRCVTAIVLCSLAALLAVCRMWQSKCTLVASRTGFLSPAGRDARVRASSPSSLSLRRQTALGLDDQSLVYRARKGGEPVALVIEAAAPDGYSGRIGLLLAIRASGELAAVRVTQHKETPGLGDYIDPAKDRNKARPWISQFNGLATASLSPRDWKVKKDGGRFDANAGATVTPRAVVKAVFRAVEFAAANQDALYSREGARP